MGPVKAAQRIQAIYILISGGTGDIEPVPRIITVKEKRSTSNIPAACCWPFPIKIIVPNIKIHNTMQAGLFSQSKSELPLSE